MKFFTNKCIWSKIVIVLIFVLLFEFVVTKPTLASGAEVGDTVIEFGGKLMSPILSLVVSVADAAMGIAQLSIMGTEESVLPIDVDASIWEILGKVFVVAVAVVAAIVVVVGTVASGGALLGVIAGIAGGLFKVGVAAAIGWFVVDLSTSSASTGISNVSASAFPDTIQLPSTVYLPVFSMSPEEIFQGKVLLFNVDFFGKSKEIMAKGKDSNGNEVSEKSSIYGTEKSKISELEKFYYVDDNGQEVTTSKQDIASDLQGTLATWYVGIRNIVLVGMMIVLLYIGIRMMLSTIASDKAKYKQLLQDWFVGLLLVFFIHYIMAFSVTLVEKLTNVVSSSVDKNAYAVKFPVDENGKMVKWFNEKDMTYMVYDANGNCLGNEDGTQDVSENDAAYIIYPTNILGKLRLDMQMCTWGPNYIGYALAYTVLVMFTIYFVFTYLRRVLYMAFLTMIAPMVALTYPIDKVSDGSAQGFSKWFKEYTFNLLIQPMHLLLYYVLVTSAFDLAGKNLIYSLVAIGFMIPAEKLLRSIFGFEKARTPGVLAGPAGAALTMGALQKLNHLRMPKPPKFADKGGATSINEANNEQLPRFNEDFDEAGIMAGVGGAEPAADNANLPTGNVSQEEIDADNELQQELNARKARGENIEKEQAALDAMRQKDNFDKVNEANENEALEQQTLQLKENEETKKKIKDMPKKARMKYFARNVMHNPKTRAAIGMAGRVGKTAGAVSLGVAAGAVGAATGIVTGSPGDVWKNAAIGASAGYTGGKTIGDGIGGGKIQNNIKEAIDRDYERARQNDENFNAYGEEMQVRASEKAYRKALKRNNFSKEEIDKLSQNGTLERYIRNEVSAEDAATGEVMRRDDASLSQDEVIATAKYSERVGDAVKGPDREKWKEHFTKEFSKKANLDETRAKRVADATLDRVERFQKQRKKLIK